MLQVLSSHNIRIRGASTPLKAAITKALTMDNPEYVDARKKRRPTWGMKPDLKLYLYDQGDIIAPRGFLDELRAILTAQGIDPDKVITQNLNEGRRVEFGPWNPVYVLRDYQTPLVEALKEGNGVGVAPAGSGKTIMGMRYIFEVGRPTLWFTHTKDLMYQTKERAEATLQGVGRVGILGDDIRDYGDGKLIIATVQTLQANPHLVEALDPIIGVVVIDEAHHFPAPQFIDVAAKFTAARIIGLTATPDRKDRLERYMYMGIGPKRYTVERDNLYDNGQLVKPEVKFVFTDFLYEQASLREGNSVDAGGEDIDYGELMAALINDRARTELVATNILEYAPRGTSIVITESVRYCFYLRDAVESLARRKWGVVPRMAVIHGGLSRYTWRVARNERDANNKAAAFGTECKYDGSARRWKVKTPQYTESEFQDWQVTGAQRKEILQAVRDKKIDILFATQLAREGLDIPHLTVGHMAMPKRGDASNSNNGGAVEQEIGRTMRPDPNNPNKQALWLDYVDYNVGILQSQYYSRRRVYKRLGLIVPAKTPKQTERDMIDSFLSGIPL